MRICIVTPYFTPFVRGNEYGLAESLSKLGNDVTILTSKSKAPREKAVFDGSIDKSLPFDVIYLKTVTDLFENPVVTGVFSKVTRKFDVVMLQEDYPLICHMAYFAAKRYGITTVLSSERTYIPFDFKKRLGLAFFDSSISQLVRENVDILTTHCTASKKFLKDVIGVKRNIEVIHVGVDCELFKPIKEPMNYIGYGCEDLRILSVSRFHKYKGLEYLIRAMKKVIDEVNAKLYILGKGEEELYLKNLTKGLGISGHVEFITTSIPNEEMPHVYSSCDIYVQPSVIEPYGIAVLEAMACGKPVVGTNVGGLLDTIVHGKTGFRVKPASSKKIAEYILQLSKDKLRRKLGKNARRRAEKFDWIEISKRYIKLIEN
ncbi:hypothetical protein DRO97_08020 [Archaeoglobales archaeon]|nr:MAG: hypothetical protein DRO97_08020 [Archaeoglobales archaeon]